MADGLLALRGADQPAGAAHRHLPLRPRRLRAAYRAVAGKTERLRPLGTALGDDADHLGDHVAGPAHPDRIPDPDVLALDLVLIVQRRVGDRGPADHHRVEPRDGGEGPGAAHLHVDADQTGQRLLGRILVRDGPAWRPRHLADHLPRPQVVQLEHDAVDVVAQRIAAAPHLGVVREAGVDAVEHPRMR